MKKYQTILIDPPWPEHGAGRIKRGADRHYPLMTIAEIRQLLLDLLVYESEKRIGSIANPCHCYLWVTNNYLKSGIEILESVGFRYITNIAWIKDRMGLGQYFRGQHELCLFGVFGKCKTQTRNLSTVIIEKKRKHSQKPRKMYELIEKASLPPRLELFARERREGWDAWGTEAPTSIQSLFAVKHR